MARKYPRRYVVVEDGKCKEIRVKDPVHECAIIIKHSEATGLNRPEEFDDSQFVDES
jgi:hypothetical protein